MNQLMGFALTWGCCHTRLNASLMGMLLIRDAEWLAIVCFEIEEVGFIELCCLASSWWNCCY